MEGEIGEEPWVQVAHAAGMNLMIFFAGRVLRWWCFVEEHDVWEEREDTWIRHHNRYRKRLFVPEDVRGGGGPDPRDLTHHRVTLAIYAPGSAGDAEGQEPAMERLPPVRGHNWRDRRFASYELPRLWKGQSIFVKKSARVPDVVVDQVARLEDTSCGGGRRSTASSDEVFRTTSYTSQATATTTASSQYTVSKPPDSSHAPVDLDLHRVAYNYLLFLRMCRNAFFFLTLVSAAAVAWQFGMPALRDITLVGEVGPRSFWLMYVLTWVYGLIVIVFARIFQFQARTVWTSQRDTMLLRTLWLSQMPVKDNQTRERFIFHDYELGSVESILEDALNHKIITLMSSSSNCESKFEKLGKIIGIADRLKHQVLLRDATGLDESYRKLKAFCEAQDSDEAAATTYVEKIHMALVVDRWYAVYSQMLDVQERVSTYRKKVHNLHQQRPLQPSLWGDLGRRVRLALAEWRLQYIRKQKRNLELEHDKLRLKPHAPSGSVFVTLTEARYADVVIEETAPHWWSLRSYSYFTFGQKPLSSVTLRCRRAPHPSDMIWENLHITETVQRIRFWVPTLILVVAMVIFIRPLTQLDTFVSLLHDHPPPLLHSNKLQHQVARQMPSLALQLINLVLLPTLIDTIATNGGNHQKSSLELQVFAVNYFFLVFNIVVLPFLGLKSLPALFDVLRGAVMAETHRLKNLSLFVTEQLAQRRGCIFNLQYLLSSAFFSGAWNLLQPAMYICRRLAVRLAVTETDEMQAKEPWPFAWGYWYAYMLSLLVLGLSVSIAVPLALPVACITFHLRHEVDRRNFVNGAFALGPAECIFLPRVVFLMRAAVAYLWILMGLSFASVCEEPVDAEDVSCGYIATPLLVPLRVFGPLLCIGGCMLLGIASYSQRMLALRLALGLEEPADFVDKGFAKLQRLSSRISRGARRASRFRLCSLPACICRSCCCPAACCKAFHTNDPQPLLEPSCSVTSSNKESITPEEVSWESLPEEMRKVVASSKLRKKSTAPQLRPKVLPGQHATGNGEELHLAESPLGAALGSRTVTEPPIQLQKSYSAGNDRPSLRKEELLAPLLHSEPASAGRRESLGLTGAQWRGREDNMEFLRRPVPPSPVYECNAEGVSFRLVQGSSQRSLDGLATSEERGSAVPSSRSLSAQAEESVEGLFAWLVSLDLQHRFDSVNRWCIENGAGFLEEVQQEWEDLDAAVGFTEEERTRLYRGSVDGDVW